MALQPRKLAAVAFAVGFAVLASSRPALARAPQTDAQVRAAMLGLYVHGVDDALAQQVLGPAAIPALRRLLAEPGFPRRDNVVAFLAHLDGGSATTDLLDLLARPPASVAIPEEERALLLTPQALGRIAARGDKAALQALLEMTVPGGDGGPLARAAALSADPASLRTDLIEMALHGLALSAAPEARARLEEIARPGLKSGASLRRDLSGAATGYLKLMAPGAQSAIPGSPAGGPLEAASAPPGSQALAPGGVVTDLFDTQTIIHQSLLDYANHVQTSPPMADARLDAVLAEANRKAGRSDFTGDVACCVQVARLGSDQLFGSVGDGLDIINNEPELTAVLTNGVSRAKVVRQISFCGGPGTNIIGCAYRPGFGMAVVRLSDLATEAILWIHEYGHNTGLTHSLDARGIMFGTDTGFNNGLTQFECDSYHMPDVRAGITPVENGVCADSDGDEVANHLDNCPQTYNVAQADYDIDQMGDDCDADDDNDLVDDGLDCAALNERVWTAPGQATDLTLTEVSGDTQLDWTAPASLGGTIASIGYDVIQSSRADEFQSGASCIESDDGPNTTATTAPNTSAIWAITNNGFQEKLGTSVARAGLVNGDGFPDIIVGVPGFSSGQPREGRAQIHYGSMSGPDGIASWVAEGGSAQAAAGTAVASAGDVNHDGFDDVLVGAPGYDDGVAVGGAVLVYMGGPAGPSTAASVTLSAGQPGALFGQSVAGAGDVNNDGFDDVIVGAPLYDNGFTNEGQVFVYLGSAAGLSLSPVWTASGGQDDAWLGQSVAGAGDVDGDGFDDVIAGAPLFDNGQPNEGTARLYPGSATGPAPLPSWSIEGDQDQAQLGGAVAGAGRVAPGLYDAVIVGARFFDNGETDEGRALLFQGSGAGLPQAPSWSVEGDEDGAQLGGAVASAGDINADGSGDVIVGSPGAAASAPNSGAVAVYLGGPTGPDSAAAIRIQGDQQDSGFGQTVAGAGDVSNDGRGDILVGAPGLESFLPDEGFAFVFPGSAALKPPAGQSFYYLIRAENLCGDGGTGTDSSGVPRQSTISCP